MTSRERVDAALNHKTPDRTPVFEYVLLSPLADTLLGRPYSIDEAHWEDIQREKGWRAAVRQRAIDQLDLALLLGHDMIYMLPNPDPPTPRSASPRVDAKDSRERVRQRIARAAADLPLSDDIFLIYEDLKEAMQDRGVDLPILAPAYAHGVWTYTDLMETMLIDPELAHSHFAQATLGSLALIEKYVSLGIDQIGVGGDFSGTRPLISPQMYREFIVPEVRQLSTRIHKAGGYAINASDGNLWSVLDDFLFGCDVDGYLEIDLFASMDLQRLKSVCRDRITLYGNLDCGNTLSFASPEEVRTHTIACIEAGAGNGGHILCASNAITASVPLENYLAVVNAYRDVFSLPKFVLV